MGGIVKRFFTLGWPNLSVIDERRRGRGCNV